MYRIDNATSANAPLAPPTAIGKAEGYFSGGNPSTATPATIVDAEWLNMVQEEISNAVLASGQTLDKARRDQLSTAFGFGNFVLKAGDTMTGPLIIANGGNFRVDGAIVAHAQDYPDFFMTADPAKGLTAVNFAGVAPNSYMLGVDRGVGTLLYFAYGTGAPSFVAFQVGLVGDGVFTGNSTAISHIDVSDGRLKSNEQPWTAGMAEILQIETISYQIADRPETFYGVIAQDLETFLPEAVRTLPDTFHGRIEDERGVVSSTVFYAAVNAIKELHARITVLEAAAP